jgi:hypothetical protein
MASHEKGADPAAPAPVGLHRGRIQGGRPGSRGLGGRVAASHWVQAQCHGVALEAGRDLAQDGLGQAFRAATGGCDGARARFGAAVSSEVGARLRVHDSFGAPVGTSRSGPNRIQDGPVQAGASRTGRDGPDGERGGRASRYA